MVLFNIKKQNAHDLLKHFKRIIRKNSISSQLIAILANFNIYRKQVNEIKQNLSIALLFAERQAHGQGPPRVKPIYIIQYIYRAAAAATKRRRGTMRSAGNERLLWQRIERENATAAVAGGTTPYLSVEAFFLLSQTARLRPDPLTHSR